MEKAIKISVIICTYNRAQYIYQALESITKNNYPVEKYEIILINNNSTDNTEKEYQRFIENFPEIPLRYFIENSQGLSFARNRGAREAQGDILVYLDDDAFVCDTYLQTLSSYIQEYPDLVAFGGKITPLFEAGIIPSWLGKWSYSWVSALDMGTQVKLFKNKAFPIGANMGFRRECITRYGYFNTELGRSKSNLLAGEEKDYFNRLKKEKEKIYYLPNLKVQHVIPAKRTTTKFIKELALGIGQSEQLRTLSISKGSYYKRIFAESIKWGATIILFTGYLFAFKPQKGIKLFLFRRYVTQGLLNK